MKLNIVPARTGFIWVRLGFRTFLQQPLAMSGLFFLYMAAASLLVLVPVIGPVLALMIVPAAALGLMAGSKEAEKGKFPMPAVLISAFRASRQQARSMLVLGALYTAACLLISMVLVPLLVSAPPVAADAGPEAMLTPQFNQTMLVTLLFYFPVSLLFWHAPALVHWHDISPVKSLFFSFVACVRNAGALVMFGLGWFAIFFGVSTVVTVISALMGGASFMLAAMIPIGLLMTAMFSTSIYFTFRDSFTATPTDADADALAPASQHPQDPDNPGDAP